MSHTSMLGTVAIPAALLMLRHISSKFHSCVASPRHWMAYLKSLHKAYALPADFFNTSLAIIEVTQTVLELQRPSCL